MWLLVTGQLPSVRQRAVLDAALVAIAEHGLVPSVQASRMTLAAALEALQGAVAGGILGCGSVILGAAEGAGQLLAAVIAALGPPSPSGDGARFDEAAASVREHLSGANQAARRAVPGFGHPLHNVSVGIPAVLLDAGYPLLAMRGVPILARMASLIAHLLEEQSRPIGVALSQAGADAISYDGAAPRVSRRQSAEQAR